MYECTKEPSCRQNWLVSEKKLKKCLATDQSRWNSESTCIYYLFLSTVKTPRSIVGLFNIGRKQSKSYKLFSHVFSFSTDMKYSKAPLLFSSLLISLSLPHLSLSQSPLYNDNTTICSNSSNRSIEYVQCLNDAPEWESCPDPSLCEPATGNNVGLAFGLTIGAGLATTLGALLPFIPFIKRSNTTFLAVGLALAAGVMLYVSFTEILKKSKDNFCCSTPQHYEVAATGCFFGGIVLTILLDLLVTLLQRLDCGCTSKCSRRRSQELGGHDETKSSKLKPSLAKHKVNGLHKEFDFVHYHSEGGHTPMVSSSEVSTISTPTADSLEDGEEPVVMVPTETNNGETESATLDPMPLCSSQRALLANEVDSNGNTATMTRQSSISDTESRRHAAITPDGVSTSLSENTNNYANASVNELFSNSSLLRMNAVILPETVNGSLASDEVGVVIADSKSHLSVTVEECGEDGEAVMVVDSESEKKAGPHSLVRRRSYSEMVEQVSADSSK